MKKQDHLDLYEEIKTVLYKRTQSLEELTEAQVSFVKAFEEACFEVEFLKCYATTVDKDPSISLRNLHAFCLGHGLGRALGSQIMETSETNH